MNDCIDERVVDGRCLGDDSGHGFGIRIQDASVSGKEEKGTSSSFPADSFWTSDLNPHPLSRPIKVLLPLSVFTRPRR